MRKTLKRGNKKKNKRGGVSRGNAEGTLKSTKRILHSLPIPHDAANIIYATFKESKFLNNLKENVTQRKDNKERIERILYMLLIEDDDSDEIMRNKVINSNKLVINLLKSLRSNLMWRKHMTTERYVSIFDLVDNINGVLMRMVDPREDRIIENRTFNNLNFDAYRDLIHAANTEEGSDDARYALYASDAMLLRNRIIKFCDVIDTTVATIITSNMSDVLQEIEQNLSPIGGKLYN